MDRGGCVIKGQSGNQLLLLTRPSFFSFGVPRQPLSIVSVLEHFWRYSLICSTCWTHSSQMVFGSSSFSSTRTGRHSTILPASSCFRPASENRFNLVPGDGVKEREEGLVCMHPVRGGEGEIKSPYFVRFPVASRFNLNAQLWVPLPSNVLITLRRCT